MQPPLARARRGADRDVRLWLYLLAPLLGASLAGLTCQLVRGEHTRPAELPPARAEEDAA